MLAAATSSRPAVTRRAYECGGVDADGDGIVTAGERRRQARARPRSFRSKVVDRQRDRKETAEPLLQLGPLTAITPLGAH